MVDQSVQQMPIFEVSDDQLITLKTHGEEIHLLTGQVLFNEDDPARGLFVIVSGEVEIYKRIGEWTVTLVRRAAQEGGADKSLNGPGTLIAAVRAGSFVGETSLLTVLPRVYPD